VEGSEDGVVHHVVRARYVYYELGYCGAACWDEGGLHVVVLESAGFYPDFVEDLADDVEAAGEVGAAVTEEETDGVAGFYEEGVVADQRVGRAVEHYVGGVFVYGALHVEVLEAALAEVALGVEVALHDVELVVHFREAFLGLHHDQTVHAVGYVHAYRRGGTVVDVNARVESGEREGGLLPRGDERGFGAAALAVHGVQVDVVRHHAAGVVLQGEGHVVAVAHADHRAGHGAAEGPEHVLDARSDLLHFFDAFEFHLHVGAV